MMIRANWTDDDNSDNQTKVEKWWQFFRHNIKIAKSNLEMLAWHKDVPLIVSGDGFIMRQVWNSWILYNGKVTKTSNEILTSETVRRVISVLRSLLCALLFNWVIGRETKAGGNLRSRSLPHFPYLLRAWKQNHISDGKDILVKSCEVCF